MFERMVRAWHYTPEESLLDHVGPGDQNSGQAWLQVSLPAEPSSTLV